MTREDALSPTADGRDNVGLVVGFNLPVYRRKLAAGVCEAQARAAAEARRYEAERDRTYREVKDLMTRARARRDLIDLLRTTILPKSRQALEAAAAGYLPGNLDYVTLNTARVEVLQVELQLARLEAELGQALADLERVVGVQLNEHPPSSQPTQAAQPPSDPQPIPIPQPVPRPPPDATLPGPFRPLPSR